MSSRGENTRPSLGNASQVRARSSESMSNGSASLIDTGAVGKRSTEVATNQSAKLKLETATKGPLCRG